MTQPSATPRTVPASDRPGAPEMELPERIPWSVLGPEFIKAWGYPRGERMPEHVEILGQNGSGKSWFQVCILLQRQIARGSHIVVICTKPADATMLETGWPVIDSWPPDDPRQTAHIFWPQAHGLSAEAQEEQARKIYALLSALWKPNSNVIVVFDEIADLCTDLNTRAVPLRAVVIRYYREARSQDITCVGTTQRAQGVVRQVHSESKWTVAFAPKDEDDAERMAQVLGSKKRFLPILKQLNGSNYEFLIVHNLTGTMYISWIDHPLPKAPDPKRRK